MPPTLGKISIQTLTCGALIFVGAVISGATISTTAIPLGAAEVVKGLVGALSGLAGEVVADDYLGIAKRFRPSAEVLQNHDLTKAVGMAIAVVIKHAATKDEFHNHRNQLEKLAQKAVKYYPSIAEEDIDNVFAGIQEEHLPAIFSARAEEFSQVKALTSKSWKLLLDWLTGKKEVVLLPKPVLQRIANELHNTFPQALREVLKEDATRGGKAFSGIMLSLLGEIAADLRNLRIELNQKCDRILVEVRQLKAMRAAAPDVAQLFQQLLAQVQSGSSQELQVIAHQLVGIEAKVNATLDIVKGLEDKLKQLTPQRPDTDLSDLRPAISNWQGRKQEIEDIDAWLLNPDVHLISIVGVGGFGKSTLAAKIFDRRTDFRSKLWVDLRIRNFTDFVGRGLQQFAKLSNKDIQAIPEKQRGERLITCLRKERYLLVFDNLETLLQVDGLWRDSFYKQFLDSWLACGGNSVILVTTQEHPISLERNPYRLSLAGLAPDEGAQLLQKKGIRGTTLELENFSRLVHGCPLQLRVVADLLLQQEGKRPPLSRLSHYLPRYGNLLKIPGQHHGQTLTQAEILDASFNRLSSDLQTLLLNLTVYQRPFNAEAAKALVEQEVVTTSVEEDLKQLERCSLLQSQEQRGANKELLFGFQEQILNYAKQKAGELPEAQKRAISYYQQNVKPKNNWQTKDDITEYLEQGKRI